MKKPAVNPYLPLNNYIPDAEPRLFNDRLYIYGSHDKAGGDFFCLKDYVVWSAPKDDLADWRYDGVIYRRGQDPSDPEGKLELFAPDVVQGPDGRYYLYYCLRMKTEFGVAVSDTPTGPFTFHGHVKRPDGSIFNDHMPYDPSVLVDDDGSVYLYYGFSSAMLSKKYNTEISPGALVVELEQDMLTTCSPPTVCIPWEGLATGTGFEGHAYCEAPSIRKIGNLYYLVYSSQWWHELCYAVSQYPTKGYCYGGVIVDNADIGYNGRNLPVCMPGNNHGGLVTVNNQSYIFYHRHTHGTSYSRQGCAEPVTFDANGHIAQVGITSSGLNGGPLPALGQWPAAIACYLSCPKPQLMLDFRNVDLSVMPYITQEDAPAPIQYIHNFYEGVIAGFNQFYAKDAVHAIVVTVRGTADGELIVYLDNADNPPAAVTALSISGGLWQDITIPISFNNTHSLFFGFTGHGTFDFLYFCWQ
ncbi:MAG: family 43 glycosylhydrolase [Oscillospiraceae bacterium]